LSDSTGKTIEYVYWGGRNESKVKALYDSIKADSVLRVQGKVSSYNEKLQLATNEPFELEVLEEGQYNKEDFIKPSTKDIGKMQAHLMETIEKIGNPSIKKLLKSVFDELGSRFSKHPAAIEVHHNCIGGLLEHTLEVLGFCEEALKHFSLDKDLLIAGALLHDIGKIDELEITSRIKGSEAGQLVGHLVLGTIFVSNKMDKLGFDKGLKNKLLHLMVSHHGRFEYGSPKEPMFPEAVALYYADEMSSKLSEMTTFVDDAKQDTEDNFMYSKRNGRNVFLR